MAKFFKLAAGTAVVCTALYALGGYVGIPYAARFYLEHSLAGQLGRQVNVGSVKFNPWTWLFTMRDVTVAGKNDQPPLASLKELRADISSRTFVHFAPVLEELSVDGLDLHVPLDDEDIRKYVEKDGDASGGEAAKSSEAKSGGGLPDFALYNIAVKNSSLRLLDRARGADQRISDFNLSLPFVSTLPNAKESLVTPTLSFLLNGTPITAVGSTKPFGRTLEAQLQMRIKSLDIVPIARLVPSLNTPALRLERGRFSTDMHLVFRNPSGGQPGKMLVSGVATLSDVRTEQKAGSRQENLLNFQKAVLTLTELDLIEQHADIAGLTVDAPSFTYVQPTKTTESQPASAAAGKASGETAGGWQWKIDALQLNNGTVTYIDPQVRTKTPLTATNINATVSRLNSTTAEPAQLSASGSVLGGKLSAKVAIVVKSAEVTADLSADGLKSAALAPYIRNALNADVTASASLKAHIASAKGNVKGNGTLSLRDASLRQNKATLVSAQAADITVSAFDLNGRSVAVKNAVLTKPVINAEKKAQGLNLALLGNSTQSAPAAAAANGTAKKTTEQAWKWALTSTEVKGGTVTYKDSTLKPAPSVTLTDAALKLANISSEKNKQGSLTFSAGLAGGKISAKGPLTVTPLQTTLDITASSLQMKTLSPMMAAYAGIGAKNGVMQTSGKLTYADKGTNEPQIEWLGSSSLSSFNMTNTRGQSLMTWNKAELTDLHVKTGKPLYLTCKRAEIVQPGTKETNAVREAANIVGAIAAIAGKTNTAEKITKYEQKLSGSIVIEDIRYENGSFSAEGVSPKSLAGALLQKLTANMAAKLNR